MTSPTSSAWPPFTLPLVDLLSGSLAGSAQVLIGQPLDTLKVRLQSSSSTFSASSLFLHTLRTEGFFAFYRGLTPPLVGVAAQTSLLFTSFNLCKRIISPDTQDVSIAKTAIAGAAAGGINTVLSSPIELLKVRQQVDTTRGRGRSMLDIFFTLKRDHGWRAGVYRGFWITFWREIPAYAAFYAAFETSKRTFSSRLSTHDDPASTRIPIWALMVSGSLGGIANWLASYPLDVIKSRVQLSNQTLESGFAGWRYIHRHARYIWSNEGPKAFVRGLSPTLLRAIPAAAATFTTFEVVKNALQA